LTNVLIFKSHQITKQLTLGRCARGANTFPSHNQSLTLESLTTTNTLGFPSNLQSNTRWRLSNQSNKKKIAINAARGRAIRMMPQSQLLFDKSFFISLENQGRESITPTHTHTHTHTKCSKQEVMPLFILTQD
jgi:hypothetical protein